MNLPEPVAWRVKDDEASDHYGKSVHAYYDSADIRLDHPNAKKLTALLESLFTEAQLREAYEAGRKAETAVNHQSRD